MAIAYESGGGGTGPNAGKTAAQIAAEVAGRSVTTTTERNRESGKMYGSTNTGITVPRGAVAAQTDETRRESGAFYGSGNTGVLTPTPLAGGGTLPGGGTNPVIPGGSGTVSSINTAKDDILTKTLTSYGMEGIGNIIKKIRAENPEISQEDLIFLLKNDSRYNGEYLARFAGNAILKAKGMPTVDDATYLKAEKEYEKIFTAYGTTSLANRSYYAQLIGNSMDAADVSNRIDLAYNVYKGNPNIKNAFNTFYGTVTDGDVVAAMLDPETQVPLLKKKITVAEIGGAALQQNLSTSLAKAKELEAFGITGAQAQAGYQTIAQGLPTYEKLLEMRTGSDVKTEDAQALLEQTKFKKNAQAIANEQAVVGQEIARFGGSAGRLASKDRSQGLL